MQIGRRSFLAGFGAAIVAPYVVRNSGLLMPVADRTLVLYGDLAHDDTKALQALFDGHRVLHKGEVIKRIPSEPLLVPRGVYRTTDTLNVTGSGFQINGSSFFAEHDNHVFNISGSLNIVQDCTIRTGGHEAAAIHFSAIG
jgi:hypothetical protein